MNETTPTQKSNYLITAIMLTLLGAGIIYLSAFKMLDRDFWWHITAGKIMTQTHSLIKTGPFAHTREGLPYLATHEWLAQVILYAIHSTGGIPAIIAFRTLSMAVTFGLLLLIDKKRIWINTIFVLLGAVVAQGGFMDRPQLLTFMIFSGWILLSIHALTHKITMREIAIGTVLQIIWVNSHGAASILGIMFVGSLLAQRLWQYMRDTNHKHKQPLLTDIQMLALWSIATLLALLVSPAGLGNITYLYNLMGDQTIQFISEWQPRPWDEYLPSLGPIIAISIIALILGKKDIVFSALLLGATFYASRQAVRHEMLFAFTATGLTIYQLKFSLGWHNFLSKWKAHKKTFAMREVFY